MKPKKVRNREVVYLGGEPTNTFQNQHPFNSKLLKLAKLFRKIKFTNINLDIKRSSRRKNYFRQRAGFLEGLKNKANSSIDIIRSELALGYFTVKNGKAVDKFNSPNLTDRNITAYTSRVLKIAKQKLTKRGKIVIIAENSGDFGASAFDNIKRAAELTGLTFNFRAITKAEIENAEFWTKHAHQTKKKLFVITLTK